MADQDLTPYDEIDYPGRAYAATHPDHLASLAYLFGLEPAPADHCRVLEIACGDGANLIPVAYNFANSEFLGIDLAGQPITRGRDLIQELGLKNISLLQMNLMNFGEGFGRFDYVIAHGIYSWVPAEVQDQLLRNCGEHLSPEGVAFVSYNTYPGFHIRQMLREILLFHVHHAPDAMTRIQQARALSDLLGDAFNTGDSLASFLKEEWNTISRRPPGSLYHDELADVSLPVYFHEFVAHAARHGLQYLAESELFTMYDHGMSEPVRQAMSELEDQRILREQYLDFIRVRRFRQTLLCHQEISLEGNPKKERLRNLRAASRLSVESATVDLDAQTEARFQGPTHGFMTSSHPVVKALMLVLINQWPCSLAFPELVGTIQSRFEGSSLEELTPLVEEALLAALKMGALELHQCEPRIARDPGERPHVSRVARLQAAKGEAMTSLRHISVRMPNDAGREALRLMDGTRDREVLALELKRLLGSEVDLEALLKELGRLALLM